MSSARLRMAAWRVRIPAAAMMLVATVAPACAADSNGIEHLIDPDTIHPVSPEEFQAVLEHHVGKVVVVNFWATWCVPCIQELPELDLLQERYGDRGLVVIAVSADEPEKLEDLVIPFLTRRAPGLTGYLGMHENSPLDFVYAFDPEWPGALPTTMFFDRGGELVNAHWGRMLYGEFEEVVLGLLGEEG